MKQHALALSIALATSMAGLAPQAQAFGLSDLTSTVSGGSTASSVSAGDVDTFVHTAQEADKLINMAANHIYSMVATKEKVAEYEASIKAANGLTDPKEKEAKVSQIKADRDTDLKKLLASKEAEDKIKGMNKTQLKNFANASFTFMLGLLKDKQLADGSTALVSGVSSNPTLLPKMVVLKDAASSVVSQAKSAAAMGEGLVKLAKIGKVNIMPASASEKPKLVQGEI